MPRDKIEKQFAALIIMLKFRDALFMFFVIQFYEIEYLSVYMNI